ncbi:MAG: OmpA family protein [Bacteroidetes bacterium]|nr:OmpA family protein [Bacteroidota bacterium]
MARVFFFLTLISSITFTACRTGKLPVTKNNAVMLYEKQNYSEAVKMLEKLNKKAKEEEKKLYTDMLADSYTKMNDYKNAAKHLKSCISLFPNKREYRLQYANMLMGMENYPEAINQLNEYIALVPGNKVAAETKKMCELAIQLQGQGTGFTVESMIDLNTKYNEYAPVSRPTGLYFTSDRPDATGENKNTWLGTEYADIFVSRVVDNEFEKPRPVGEPISTPLNEGVCSFNEQGNIMAYTMCKDAGFDSSCAIVVLRRNRGAWGKPEVLSFSLRKGFVFGHPALSPSGNTLVFSSNLAGGEGGHDLWITNFENGNWSTPANLGSKINSARDEMFPVFTNENTLYFSSNGHPGFGGLDIFKSIKVNGKWRKPDNLLVPLNSGGDDFGITFNEDGSTGYFSSNRPESEGDDLYKFTMQTPPLCKIEGQVFSQATKKPLANSTVYLTDLVANKVYSIPTDERGSYQAYICYDRDYKLDAYQKYYTNNQPKPRITTRGLKFEKTFTQNFFLDKWVIDEIRLEGILYDLAKADIRPDAAVVLDSLARILTIHSYLVVELSSHTDCRGDSAYNYNLSQQRAKSCVDYLVSKGIEKDRLVAQGYGETKLLNNCACEQEGDPGYDCTEEQHQRNRRTSFTILRTDYKPLDEPEFGEPYLEPECN